MFLPKSLARIVIRMSARGKSVKIFVLLSGLLFWFMYKSSSKTHKRVIIDEMALKRYRPPPQAKVDTLGRTLEIEPKYWKKVVADYVELLQDEILMEQLTNEGAKEFVFATAASRYFYDGCLASISTVQQFFPQRRIFFYDLEDPSPGNSFIHEKAGLLCGVTHRYFNFTLYPSHVRQLKFYAWKPLIIFELLKEHPGVFWIDSSIRFFSSNMSQILSRAVTNGGPVAVTSTGHSNFAVTHQIMYSFLPTSRDGMIKTIQHEANCVLFYRTRLAVQSIIWWWVICALDPLCIAPIDKLGCNNPYRSAMVYADCHRFDQSALNVILANYFAYDDEKYYGRQGIAEVHRNSMESKTIAVCSPQLKERGLVESKTYLKDGPIVFLTTPNKVNSKSHKIPAR